MQKAQGANIGVTAVCVLTNEATRRPSGSARTWRFASFSRSLDEDEADREAVKYTVRAGIDPTGIPEMFQILLAEREAKPGTLDTSFRPHPLEESRIAASRNRIAAYPPSALVGLTKDTPNFEAFKKRLASLPPSPPSKDGVRRGIGRAATPGQDLTATGDQRAHRTALQRHIPIERGEHDVGEFRHPHQARDEDERRAVAVAAACQRPGVGRHDHARLGRSPRTVRRRRWLSVPRSIESVSVEMTTVASPTRACCSESRWLTSP